MKLRALIRIAPGVAAVAALALAGCGSPRVITRVDSSVQIDLSGNWNDSDSRQAAADLVEQSTGAATWIGSHPGAPGQLPAINVGRFANRSTEHIPLRQLVAALERDFTSSGKVRVVASAGESADQRQPATPESQARLARERGADCLLLGEISTRVDRPGGREVKFYEVDCYLVDLRTDAKVWAGRTRIQKLVGRRAYRP